MGDDISAGRYIGTQPKTSRQIAEEAEQRRQLAIQYVDLVAGDPSKGRIAVQSPNALTQEEQDVVRSKHGAQYAGQAPEMTAPHARFKPQGSGEWQDIAIPNSKPTAKAFNKQPLLRADIDNPLAEQDEKKKYDLGETRRQGETKFNADTSVDVANRLPGGKLVNAQAADAAQTTAQTGEVFRGQSRSRDAKNRADAALQGAIATGIEGATGGPPALTGPPGNYVEPRSDASSLLPTRPQGASAPRPAQDMRSLSALMALSQGREPADYAARDADLDYKKWQMENDKRGIGRQNKELDRREAAAGAVRAQIPTGMKIPPELETAYRADQATMSQPEAEARHAERIAKHTEMQRAKLDKMKGRVQAMMTDDSYDTDTIERVIMQAQDVARTSGLPDEDVDAYIEDLRQLVNKGSSFTYGDFTAVPGWGMGAFDRYNRRSLRDGFLPEGR